MIWYNNTENTTVLRKEQRNMKQCKRAAALLLALLLTVGILPLSAGAQQTLSPDIRVLAPEDIQQLVPSLTDPAGLQTPAQVQTAEPQANESESLKIDLSNGTYDTYDQLFLGMPLEPDVFVYLDGRLDLGTDYVVIYENNINVGTGTARIIGIGDYCGSMTANFEIALGEDQVHLQGAYNGTIDGELNDDYYYEESIVCPGAFEAWIGAAANHMAYYALYHVQGEEAVFVTEYESDYGRSENTYFSYDFTDVYDQTSENGYETYMLAYTWVDQNYDVYSGIYTLYIFNKVPGATSMSMGQVIDDGDFRRDYLTVVGDDGALDAVTWSSSTESVAAITDGIMTLKNPGTVTITATAGDLTVSHDFTVEALELADAEIVSPASVVYGRQELIERTDYTVSSSTADGITAVSVTGRGLFTGHLMRQFDEATGEAIGHTHTFDHGCDPSCNTCDFTRETAHQYGTSWTKDMDGHWHACAVCGDRADYAEHTLSPDDDTLCTVCGTLYIPGDLNQDFTVDEDDAIYLLQHVLLPDHFRVEQAVDYTGDGQINEDDAIYLLQHVLLPEYFPL